jgi:hypothetical protein
MVRKRTIAVLALSVFSLALITVDWRASILVAILVSVFAIANLRSAE